MSVELVVTCACCGAEVFDTLCCAPPAGSPLGTKCDRHTLVEEKKE